MQRYINHISVMNGAGCSVETMACMELEIEYLMELLPEQVRKVIQWLSEATPTLRSPVCLGLPPASSRRKYASTALAKLWIAGEGCNQNITSGLQ